MLCFRDFYLCKRQIQCVAFPISNFSSFLEHNLSFFSPNIFLEFFGSFWSLPDFFLLQFPANFFVPHSPKISSKFFHYFDLRSMS